ncbi:RnfABCDGE type electron transport complex subunit D [Candidatus Oleimmundimicrobium sp.]|uniref:RnfABCDGE type electron transport complex subunit D n=1 Tax=Candidatus Oleimmundimicrobium sp. TaxID=3060597 RepID=UPI0027195831|nr:RnfABCDGE type electron transport complex subunit D [Candidatus Oleimmundimicrobium sp.]MDO8886130.1 RnfABCDGE type electron transport complex subunit D [Candidatus Oleimmundimicrobium sp.]
MSLKPIVSVPPHIKSEKTIGKLMGWTISALLPIVILDIYLFGGYAFRTICLSIIATVITEIIVLKYRHMPITVIDGSAILTGLVLALTLPPKVPYWIPLVGGFLAIFFGKQLFGGLGYNIFNPALVGRAMLFVSWPEIMANSWFASLKELDAITTATPLAALSQVRAGTLVADLSVVYKPLFFLNRGGCLGEVSALLIILGGVILIAKKVIDWRIPVSFIGTVMFISFIAKTNILLNVLGGGLLLGAFFLLTDPVTSPVTRKGRVVYGIGCGLVIMLIRLYSGYSEGIMFAILFMNAFVSLIDKFTRPRKYGLVKTK